METISGAVSLVGMAGLPDDLLITVLQAAYQDYKAQRPGGCNPLRVVVPLVCQRWRGLLRSPAATELLFRKVYIGDACLLPAKRFNPQRLIEWFAPKTFVIEEFEVELSAVSDPEFLLTVSEALGQVLGRCTNLQVLKLSGRLQLGPLSAQMAPQLGRLRCLRTVYLSGAGEQWGVQEAAERLMGVPTLQQLQVKCASEGDPPTELLTSACGLPGLRHLALTFPCPGAIPPLVDMPPELSLLTALTTLQLKWVPAQQAPGWLGALGQLQHLFYDPYLPADAPSLLPAGVSRLTSLKTLVVPRRLATPEPIPTTLTNLETLQMSGSGYSMALDQDWDWLARLPKLKALRLQSAGLREVPEAVASLCHLTRLELMCNQLQDLPYGPYLEGLQFLHLGNNNIVGFPAALRAASALRMLYISNQRTDMDLRNVAARLEMTKDDVIALAAMRGTLHTVVLGLAQPRIELPPGMAGGGGGIGSGGSGVSPKTPSAILGLPGSPWKGQQCQASTRQQEQRRQQCEREQRQRQYSQEPPVHSQQGSSPALVTSPFDMAEVFITSSSDAASRGPFGTAAAAMLSTAESAERSKQAPPRGAAGGGPIDMEVSCRRDGVGDVLQTNPSLQDFSLLPASAFGRLSPERHRMEFHAAAAPPTPHVGIALRQRSASVPTCGLAIDGFMPSSAVVAAAAAAAAAAEVKVGVPAVSLAVVPAPAAGKAAPSQGRHQQRSQQAKRVVGFDWLQTVLRKRSIRVTSNELAYEFPTLPMFDLKHLGVDS